MNDRQSDKEKNRLSARMLRYGKVGANVGSVAARIAGRRLFGLEPEREKDATELGQLQSHAPPMGWPFVRRRMAAELGPDWEAKFANFEHEAAASASLGQVHRAKSHDGRALAAKLQYPDMQSALEPHLPH